MSRFSVKRRKTERLAESSALYKEKFDFVKSCKTCESIRAALCQSDQQHEASQDLGLFIEIQGLQCSGHHNLVEEFYTFCCETSALDQRILSPVNQLREYQAGHLYLEVDDGRVRLTTKDYFWTVCLAKREDKPGHKGKGRILNSEWADIPGARLCKDSCISSHGQECEDPLRVGKISPIWLIDTATAALVPGEGHPDFVALSYRWGGGKHLGATLANLEQLQQPGSLRDPAALAPLAPIIPRAMFLVQAMGERYLWADTLCIISDDGSQQAQEINRMGEIYASAVFTIIVADGDAKTGLHGLKGVSPARGLKQKIVEFMKEEVIVTDAHLRIDTEYDNRGWTFQEFMLSKRRLIFRRSKVFWMCHRSQVAEEFHWDEDLGDNLHSEDSSMSTVLAGLPDLHYLSSVIARYNRRTFSYEDDALPGIRGLLTLLSRTFPGGFLYGLPEMFFNQALTWTSNYHVMKKRKSSGRDQYRDSHIYALPSWSWIGWQGNALFPPEFGPEAEPQSDQVKVTIPTVEWYTSKLPCGEPRRLIQPTWETVQQDFHSGDQTLLPGWSRRECLSSNGNRRLIYTHEAIPEREFRYQFPLNRVDSSTPSINPEQTPYISCFTKRAWLTPRRKPESSGFPSQGVSLYDKEGCYYGVLQGHSTDRSGEMDSVETQVELAAICKQRTVHANDALNVMAGEGVNEELDAAPNINTEYVVLWIEWVNDVAYRRGIAWIPAASWESFAFRRVSFSAWLRQTV